MHIVSYSLQELGGSERVSLVKTRLTRSLEVLVSNPGTGYLDFDVLEI
jgi:hypothetical protein